MAADNKITQWLNFYNNYISDRDIKLSPNTLENVYNNYISFFNLKPQTDKILEINNKLSQTITDSPVIDPPEQETSLELSSDIGSVQKNFAKARKELLRERTLLYEQCKNLIQKTFNQDSQFKQALNEKSIFEFFAKFFIDFLAAEDSIESNENNNKIKSLVYFVLHEISLTLEEKLKSINKSVNIFKYFDPKVEEKPLSADEINKVEKIFKNDLTVSVLDKKKYPRAAMAYTRKQIQLYREVLLNTNYVEKLVFGEEGKQIQEFLLSFKRKIDSGYEIEQNPEYEAKFKELKIDDLDEEDKNLYYKIHNDNSPFDEIEKFIKLCKTKVYRPGLLFILLFKVTNGGNKPFLSFKEGNNNGLVESSDWYESLYNETSIKLDSEIEPENVLDVAEMHRFLLSFYTPKEVEIPRGPDGNIDTERRTAMDVLQQRLENDKFLPILFRKLKEIQNKIKVLRKSENFEEANRVSREELTPERNKVFSVLSPILGTYMLDKYAEQTLADAGGFKTGLINAFKRGIDKFQPGQDIEPYMLRIMEDYKNGIKRDKNGEAKLSKNRGGQRFFYGAEKLPAYPKTSDEVLQYFKLYTSLVDIKAIDMVQYDNYYFQIFTEAELEKRKEAVEVNSADGFRKKRAIKMPDVVRLGTRMVPGKFDSEEDKKKHQKAKQGINIISQDKEGNVVHKNEQIPIFAKVLIKPGKKRMYVAVPKDSLIKNPEKAQHALSYIYQELINILVKKLKAALSQEEDLVNDEPKTKITEPRYKSDNQVVSDKSPEQKNRENLLMELLFSASEILGMLNIDISEVKNRIETNIETLLVGEKTSMKIIDDILNNVQKGDFKNIERILKKQKSEKGLDVAKSMTNVLAKIVEKCIFIIKEEYPKMQERLAKADLHGSYAKAISGILKSLVSAFIGDIAKTTPKRHFKTAHDTHDSFEAPIYSRNNDNSASLLSFKLKSQFQKLGDKAAIGDEVAMGSNKDELAKERQTAEGHKIGDDSDARQTALETLLYVLNRKAYRFQEEGFDTLEFDIKRSIKMEIDSEIKRAYSRETLTMKFGSSKFSEGTYETYYGLILKKLKDAIVNHGYELNDPKWFTEVQPLRDYAIFLFDQRNRQKNANSNRLKNKSPEEKELMFEGDKRDFEKNWPEYLLSRQMNDKRKASLDYEAEGEEGEQRSLVDTLDSQISGYANDPTILEEYLKMIKDVLENRCFSGNFQLKDAETGDISEFYKRFKKHMSPTHVQMMNEALKGIKQEIKEHPYLHEKIVLSRINSLNNPLIIEIILAKYFEYLYIREVLLSRIIYSLGSYYRSKDSTIKEVILDVDKMLNNFDHKPELIYKKEIKLGYEKKIAGDELDYSNINVNTLWYNFIHKKEIEKNFDIDFITSMIGYIGARFEGGEGDFKFSGRKEDTGNVRGGEISLSSIEPMSSSDSNISVDKDPNKDITKVYDPNKKTWGPRIHPIRTGEDSEFNANDAGSVSQADNHILKLLKFNSILADLRKSVDKEFEIINAKRKEVPKTEITEDIFYQTISEIEDLISYYKQGNYNSSDETKSNELRKEFLHEMREAFDKLERYLLSSKTISWDNISDQDQKRLRKDINSISKSTKFSLKDIHEMVITSDHIMKNLGKYGIIKNEDDEVISTEHWTDILIDKIKTLQKLTFKDFDNLSPDEKRKKLSEINKEIQVINKSLEINSKREHISKVPKLLGNFKSIENLLSNQFEESCKLIYSKLVEYKEKLNPIKNIPLPKETKKESINKDGKIILENIDFSKITNLQDLLNNPNYHKNLVKQMSSLMLRQFSPKAYDKVINMTQRMKPEILDDLEIYNIPSFKEVLILRRDIKEPNDFTTFIIPKSSLSIK